MEDLEKIKTFFCLKRVLLLEVLSEEEKTDISSLVYKLSSKANKPVAYSHACKVLKKFEEEGLVKREKEKRKVLVSLTQEGKEVLECLRKVLDVAKKIVVEK